MLVNKSKLKILKITVKRASKLLIGSNRSQLSKNYLILTPINITWPKKFNNNLLFALNQQF